MAARTRAAIDRAGPDIIPRREPSGDEEHVEVRQPAELFRLDVPVLELLQVDDLGLDAEGAERDEQLLIAVRALDGQERGADAPAGSGASRRPLSMFRPSHTTARGQHPPEENEAFASERGRAPPAIGPRPARRASMTERVDAIRARAEGEDVGP